jgi:hypothetical protein
MESGGEDVRRRAIDLVRSADLVDTALVKNSDAVPQAHRLGLIVGDVDSGGAEAALKLLQFVTRGVAQLGVEIRQRLIEKEGVGVADQRKRNAKTKGFRGLEVKLSDRTCSVAQLEYLQLLRP